MRPLMITAFAAVLALGSSFVAGQSSGYASESFYGYDAETGGPTSALIQAHDGNFYGTSDLAIYRFSPYAETGTAPLTILHSVAGGADAGRYSALIEGLDGNFYGTTPSGGAMAPGRFSR